jgi:hypothetical protein
MGRLSGATMTFVGVCNSFLNGQEGKESSMYVRVTTVQLQPDKVDEAVRIFQESVIPAARQ